MEEEGEGWWLQSPQPWFRYATAHSINVSVRIWILTQHNPVLEFCEEKPTNSFHIRRILIAEAEKSHQLMHYRPASYRQVALTMHV